MSATFVRGHNRDFPNSLGLIEETYGADEVPMEQLQRLIAHKAERNPLVQFVRLPDGTAQGCASVVVQHESRPLLVEITLETWGGNQFATIAVSSPALSWGEVTRLWRRRGTEIALLEGSGIALSIVSDGRRFVPAIKESPGQAMTGASEELERLPLYGPTQPGLQAVAA